MAGPPHTHDPPPLPRRVLFIERLSGAVVHRLARGRFYYGWYIVAAVFLVGTATVGFNGPFFSIFLKPMSQEFGWTRTMTTGAVTIGTLMAAASGYVLGWVLDRYGPRWMVVAGCAILAAAYLGLSQVHSLLVFYMVYAVGRSAMQSALGRSMMNALVSKWFVQRRANAIAFATLGSSIGGVILAPVAQGIIVGYDWRYAWAFFGLVSFVLVPVPWLLLRRMPEDLGLRPDGDQRQEYPGSLPEKTDAKERAERTLRRPGIVVAETDLNLREALMTTSFWLLCLIVVSSTIAITGVTFHMVPHLTDVGIPGPVAAAAVSLFTLAQIPSVFLWGFVADRLGAKQGLVAVLLTLALGAFLLSRAESAASAYLAAGVFGAGIGGYLLAGDLTWASFFGRRNLGRIRGVSMTFQLAGNASGSLIAAVLFDWTGDYSYAFNAIIVALLASSGVLLLARRPKARTG